MFEAGSKRLHFLAGPKRLDKVGPKRPDDGSRLLVAIDDRDRVEPAAPKGVVQADSLTEGTVVAFLDRPADPQRSVEDVDTNSIQAYPLNPRSVHQSVAACSTRTIDTPFG